MIVFISKMLTVPSELAFLTLLNDNDVIVLAGNAVYSARKFQTLLPTCQIFAIMSDLNSRGVKFEHAITIEALVEMQQNHQQWITL